MPGLHHTYALEVYYIGLLGLSFSIQHYKHIYHNIEHDIPAHKERENAREREREITSQEYI